MSVSTHHDITDFVNNSVEEEVVVGGNGTQRGVEIRSPKT